MAITYKKDLAALPKLINQQKVTDYTQSTKHHIARNIFKLLSVLMAAIRTYEFSNVAKNIYKNDLNLDKIEQHIPIILAYYAMAPIMASMGCSATASTNFFYNKGYNSYQKLQTYRARIKYQSQIDDPLTEDLQNISNSSNNNINDKINQIFKELLTIMIITVLAINGFANACLSDSTNALIMLSIAYTSFSFCARSIFDKKINQEPDNLKLQKDLKILPIKQDNQESGDVTNILQAIITTKHLPKNSVKLSSLWSLTKMKVAYC